MAPRGFWSATLSPSLLVTRCLHDSASNIFGTHACTQPMRARKSMFQGLAASSKALHWVMFCSWQSAGLCQCAPSNWSHFRRFDPRQSHWSYTIWANQTSFGSFAFGHCSFKMNRWEQLSEITRTSSPPRRTLFFFSKIKKAPNNKQQFQQLYLLWNSAAGSVCTATLSFSCQYPEELCVWMQMSKSVELDIKLTLPCQLPHKKSA